MMHEFITFNSETYRQKLVPVFFFFLFLVSVLMETSTDQFSSWGNRTHNNLHQNPLGQEPQVVRLREILNIIILKHLISKPTYVKSRNETQEVCAMVSFHFAFWLCTTIEYISDFWHKHPFFSLSQNRSPSRLRSNNNSKLFHTHQWLNLISTYLLVYVSEGFFLQGISQVKHYMFCPPPPLTQDICPD